LKLLSAEFVTSATASGGIPRDGVAQIALAGRSNVGKSSLINALGRTKVARTSAAPGKTRLANVYRVALDGGPGGPGQWSVYLVDLPGYGYARGGEKAAAELRAVAESYLRGKRLRPERDAKPPGESERGWSAASAEKCGHSDQAIRPVDCALLVIDSRHPALDSDRAAAQWLDEIDVRYEIVATKIDKLSRAERARNLKTLGATFGKAARPVSAVSGEGLDDLWKMIARIARNR
jgi:GTP-binding protein